MEKVRVGSISRIDWGRTGFRKGLLDAAYGIFGKEKVHFVVIAGGLISWPALRKLWHKEIDSRVEVLKQIAHDNKVIFDKHEARIEVEEDIIAEWANDISQNIPRLKNGRNITKTYIEISTATNFDGPIGARIARELVKIRKDIRFWGECDVEFPLKQTGRLIRVISPRKSAWRSKYFSTMVDRLVEDVEKQSAKRLPDVWVVGCSASAISRPQGDARRPIISLPALHVLEEVSTSENAIGIRIIESYDGQMCVKTYSFKDLVRSERNLVPIPSDISNNEKEIITTLQKGAMTIGLLSDSTGISRRKIAEAIDRIRQDKRIPNIVFSDESSKYDFEVEWFQKELTYPSHVEVESSGLEALNLKTDSMVSFGCIHAGSTNSDYSFFVNELPSIIINRGARILVGAGDFIEGLKHNLLERGEVYGGMIYTDQERFAGTLVAKVIIDVFRERFEHRTNLSVEEEINCALLTFVYTDGNHDAWIQEVGVKPLKTFRHVLIDLLADSIEAELQKHGLHTYGLRNIVKAKVVYVPQDNPVFVLPSGIPMAIIHPRMSRTKTSSIRAQEGLEKYHECPIVTSANFHVATIVEQWEEALGNRIAVQVGTLMRHTGYEDGHLKNLDFGIICANIDSIDGRIISTDTCFVGKHSSTPSLNNKNIVDDIIHKLTGQKI